MENIADTMSEEEAGRTALTLVYILFGYKGLAGLRQILATLDRLEAKELLQR